MQAVGIIAEYNPFHTGHAHQLARTRAELGQDCPVVAVMSGNWVQQAHCAIADKFTRTRLALLGGVDLVLELPTVWATASAEGFARGGVALLQATGVVGTLSFGSEGGALAPLQEIAACLDSDHFSNELKAHLTGAHTFAAARQGAAQGLLGARGALLGSPNNNLGVEYLRALTAIQSPIVPMTILRRGAAHNSPAPIPPASEPAPEHLSATQIRRALSAGDWAGIAPYLVPGSRTVLEASLIDGIPSLALVERGLLAKLRGLSAEHWAALPDSGGGEGLPRRLERAGSQATSLEHFFELAKTKRYPHARLRRLLLWAWLGLQAQAIPDHPPYLRVLGFNPRGRSLLQEMKVRATLPILTKPAHARQLDGAGHALFELEARCTDLYDLCRPVIATPGQEWRSSPVVIS